jgi:hypothetical protein
MPLSSSSTPREVSVPVATALPGTERFDGGWRSRIEGEERRLPHAPSMQAALGGKSCLGRPARHPVGSLILQQCRLAQSGGAGGSSSGDPGGARRPEVDGAFRSCRFQGLTLAVAALLFTLSGLGEAARTAAPLVPLLRNGARAWVNARTLPERGRVAGGVNRLQLHAVSDDTNRGYIAEVRKFLKMIRKLDFRPNSFEDWDLLLADELSLRCYLREEGLHGGQMLFHGIMHLFPEFKTRLSEGARALKSWERQVGSRMGGPVSYGVILCIIAQLFREGHVWAGLWVWLQHDVYGREQDMEVLYEPDIYCDPRNNSACALQFGTRSRGLSVKTGSDRGAEVDDAYLCRILCRIKSGLLPPGAALFPHPQSYVRKLWTLAQVTLGLTKIHPLHSLRHSKPSADARSGRRSLEEIRRRGRWSQLKSVQRYSRGHALTMHLSALPPAIRQRSVDAENNYPGCLAAALLGGPASKTPLARIILDVIGKGLLSR